MPDAVAQVAVVRDADEAGAEVEVRGSGSCARAAQLRQCRARDLLAAKAVALLGTVRRAAARVNPRHRAIRVVVEPLADGAASVLDDPRASQMVGDVVEDITGSAAVEQPAPFPAGALQGDRPVRGLAEDQVAEVQARRAAVADLCEGAVSEFY